MFFIINEINIVFLRFIIGDLVNKVESVFGVRKFVVDQQWQYIIFPVDLVSDVTQFLPKIMKFFDQVTQKF